MFAGGPGFFGVPSGPLLGWEEHKMCPVCIAAATQAAIGATSAGAWTALMIKKLRTKLSTNYVPKMRTKRRM
jgi:hypothetical protein